MTFMNKLRIPFHLLVVGFLTLSISLAHAEEEIWDPIEPVNRGIFWFNDKVDRVLFEPVARIYDALLPGPAKTSVGNFFDNLRYPIYLVSDLAQFKFAQMGNHTARFLINTTVGGLGFFDPATDWGFEEHYEDVGVALAYQGVPAGPYIVIPFLGPSNLRDVVGRVADGFLHPTSYVAYTDVAEQSQHGIMFGSRAVEVVDARAKAIEPIEDARDSAVDPYLFFQGAYYQRRAGYLYDGNPPEEEYEDEDYFEEE